MREYSVEELLEGIRQHNTDVLKFIYRSYYPQIQHLVVTNSGNDDDAQDIYQDALIVIYKKILKNEIQLVDCSFGTYLYSICKLLWLKQLEKKKQNNDFYPEDDVIVDDNEELLQEFEQMEKFKLFQKHFRSLRKDCRKVLELSLEKVPLKKIAEIMGYKSDKYAKKRKYQCKEKLVDNIKKDPKFKEFI
ncbi:MAG: sigma-70 family RNA polymerase sigma factor [Bacteroidales bacterium]|nr:sigma-70 family RNA polymerase sigma factor [Bacteroidales bacterium]